MQRRTTVRFLLATPGHTENPRGFFLTTAMLLVILLGTLGGVRSRGGMSGMLVRTEWCGRQLVLNLGFMQDMWIQGVGEAGPSPSTMLQQYRVQVRLRDGLEKTVWGPGRKKDCEDLLAWLIAAWQQHWRAVDIRDWPKAIAKEEPIEAKAAKLTQQADILRDYSKKPGSGSKVFPGLAELLHISALKVKPEALRAHMRELGWQPVENHETDCSPY